MAKTRPPPAKCRHCHKPKPLFRSGICKDCLLLTLSNHYKPRPKCTETVKRLLAETKLTLIMIAFPWEFDVVQPWPSDGLQLAARKMLKEETANART